MERSAAAAWQQGGAGASGLQRQAALRPGRLLHAAQLLAPRTTARMICSRMGPSAAALCLQGQGRRQRGAVGGGGRGSRRALPPARWPLQRHCCCRCAAARGAAAPSGRRGAQAERGSGKGGSRRIKPQGAPQPPTCPALTR